MNKDILEKEIQYVKGVGPKSAEMLKRLDIYKVKDILQHYPRSYEDRTKICKIHEMENDVPCVFIGTTIGKVFTNKIRKGLNLHKMLMSDGKSSVEVVWFNQDYVKNKINPGQTYIVYGVPKIGYGKIQIENPVIEEGMDYKKFARIMPIYNLTKNMSQGYIHRIIETILKTNNIDFREPFSKEFLKENNICSLKYAVEKIHIPDKISETEIARRRLIFDELFMLQMALYTLKAKMLSEKKGTAFLDTDIEEFLNLLPFKLTNAQAKVVEEMKKDMSSKKNMNRLVQGDVGSGKTILAAIGLYIAVKNGYQAAMMAPTAILASQHYAELSALFEKLNIKCEIITSANTKVQKRKISERLLNGEIDILFGTHAVLEDYIEFKNLGFVVTDEQHRFGVNQRMKLANKGLAVDTLIMTATPIPRTLALMIYGDMDLSIVDELPPGRKEIKTNVATENLAERIQIFCKKQMNEKRQIYVVCPLIEESEENNLTSVETLVKEYKNIYSGYNVEYLHGKMKTKEKEEIMNSFKAGNIDMIISTTVIEVGVNVPNATIMMIEDADRFGLAQLHQLRGRVGRGQHQSYCILKTKTKSKASYERLKIMEKSSSGFEVSEKDLELRGPGDFFGIRQSGLPAFKIADLLKDAKVLKETTDAVKKIIEEDPNLEKEENSILKECITEKYNEITF